MPFAKRPGTPRCSVIIGGSQRINASVLANAVADGPGRTAAVSDGPHAIMAKGASLTISAGRIP